MLNLCGIVAAILKMATIRNFSMLGINSGHHNLPTYQMSLKSDNVEFVRCIGGHFENGDQQKFFQCQMWMTRLNFYHPFFMPCFGSHFENGRHFEIFQCRESIRDIHYLLPTYQILMISDNVEFLRYCGGHFENGDRQKFFNVGNHYLPTYQILMISGNVEFLPPIFYTVFWQPF